MRTMQGMDGVLAVVSALVLAAWLVTILVIAVRSRRACRELAAATGPPRAPGPLPLPLPPPLSLPACPTCASTDIEAVSSGLWDGTDRTTGADIGGTVFHGVCRRCKARVAQWNNRP